MSESSWNSPSEQESGKEFEQSHGVMEEQGWGLDWPAPHPPSSGHLKHRPGQLCEADRQVLLRGMSSMCWGEGSQAGHGSQCPEVG